MSSYGCVCGVWTCIVEYVLTQYNTQVILLYIHLDLKIENKTFF